MALHWPVMELAPVPGRPMWPVSNARLMMACAVRVASWLWLTPMVHQKETRSRVAMMSTRRWSVAMEMPVSAVVCSGVKVVTKAAKAS